ncbi:antibiotic biosynthesis monooxygenase [Sinorhizobium meliloti]
MIVTVFRSRLNPHAQDEYGPMARRMSELARTIPGYVSHKGFIAEDGERVTIVEFETEEALRQWKIHPEHAKAKRRGIESFFSDYKFQICEVIKSRAWVAKSSPIAMTPRRMIDASAQQPARQPPLITSELIDYHCRRANRMRSEAQRQAICSALCILRSLFSLRRY